MSRNAYWTNADGLVVGFGTRQITKNAGAKVCKGGAREEIVVEVDLALLSDALATTDDAIVQGALIPADSLIESATLIVDEAAVGASATLDIGTYDAAGAIVDVDGIDAGVLTAALTAGAVIACDGAVVGTVVAAGTKIGLTYETAAFTAGTGTLVIEYIPARV